MSERLIVTQIILENFKSYYGRQIVGPFNNQLTCIVGPNGSGKSNLIDALLFVFGFRAKRMRHSKLSGLIHNGPDHPNLSYARVEVHFAKAVDNSEIPGSSFVISRQVEKSGESNYYFNNQISSFKEITDLLKSQGLDFEHNRFLILQGEVQAISQMKPKATANGPAGFLEYIEDIIGSDKFIEQILECERRLDEANGERSLTLDRLRMAEKERDALQESKDEAELYLQLKQKIKVLEAQSYFSNKQKIESMLKEKEEDLKNQKVELDEKENELAELDAKFNGEGSDKKKYESDLASAKQHLQGETTKLSSISSERNRASIDVTHINSLISRTEEELHKAETAKSAAATIISNEKVEKTKTEGELQSLEAQIEIERKKLSELADEARSEALQYNKDLEEKREKYSAENENFIETEKEYKSLESELFALKRASVDRESNLSNAKSQLNNITSLKEKTESELEQIKSNCESLKEEESYLNEKLAGMEREFPQAMERRRVAGNALAEAQRLARKNQSNNEAADFLMSLKLDGVYGRLAKLGEIDRKYNAAMTAAAGNKLKYIVVDNMDIAQHCLEEVKKRRLGRVTFISLDKVTVSEGEIPPGAERIVDKVRLSDEKFYPAFFYAVKNTLVADDIEEAKRLAFGGEERQRVVTLQGQSIETAGTMSGGGSRQKEGGMDLVSDREIEVLSTESKQCDNVVIEMRGEIEKARNRLGQIRNSDMFMKVTKMEMDLESYNIRINDLNMTIEQLENENIEVNSERIAELSSMIEKIKPDLDLIGANMRMLSNEIKEIENTVLELVKNKTSAQEKIVKDMDITISDKKRSLAKSAAKIESAKKMEKNADNTIQECSGNIERNKTKLDDAKSKQAELEKSYGIQKQSKEKAEERVNECEEALQKFVEAATEYRRQRSEVAASVDSLRIKYEAAQNALKDLNRQFEYYSQKLAKSGINDEEFDKEKTEYDIEIEKEDIKQRVGKMDPNLSVLEEYAQKDAICKECLAIFKDAAEKRNEIAEELYAVKKQRLDMFLSGFDRIQTALKETYQRVALGGDAQIEIVDSLDPFGQGIIFSVRPPGKSWKPIINLSGGEKTLASLSLIFALHNFKPTPFYIMDEIDAALDFRNVSIIANFLKERTADAQFIVVTLRNNMFESADRLVGIFKVRDCTSTVSLEPSLFSGSGISV